MTTLRRGIPYRPLDVPPPQPTGRARRGAQTDERQRAALPSRQHSLADSMSGSAAAALAELENFGAYGKAPAPAEDEAPPPKRQRAPARSSASLLAEAEAELAESQVG